MLRLHILAFASMTLTAAAQAQYPVDAPTFDWSGAVPAGATLRIANVDGDIQVSPSSSGKAHVHGERTRITSGGRALVFDVVQSGSDVTICARYPDGRCDESGAHGHSGVEYGQSPAANLTVELPAGVKLAAKTGDGHIGIKDAGADVIAKSGDGEITVAGAAGTVDARSGDGDITMEAVKGAVSAHTGDGNIRIRRAPPPYGSRAATALSRFTSRQPVTASPSKRTPATDRSPYSCRRVSAARSKRPPARGRWKATSP